MIGTLVRRSLGRARSLLLSLATLLALFQTLVVAGASYVEQHQGFSALAAILPPFAQGMMTGVFSSFGAMVTFGYFHPVVVIVFVGIRKVPFARLRRAPLPAPPS